MSRIAKKPLVLPNGVSMVLADKCVSVMGPLGELYHKLGDDVSVDINERVATVSVSSDAKNARAMSGTLRAILANMIIGVSEGFTRKLLLVGVGYKSSVQNDVLNLELGYSHPIRHTMPHGIKVQVPSPNEIVLTGIDKQLIGYVAAQIRAYRPPEPYKGKGVRYVDEVIVIKETKKK